MICYRIAKTKYAGSAHDMVNGEGASIYGGRWNPPGLPAVYASENLSLATLEVLVHAPLANVLHAYSYLRIEVDEDALTVLDVQSVGDRPEDLVGADYLGEHLGFVVPSKVLSLEHNIVLNPLHPDWTASVTYGAVAALPIDERLLARSR